MTASDSLPVQFWDADDETSNEKAVCGIVKQDCFCQPFKCDDSIVLQFSNDVQVNAQIINESGAVVQNVPLTEIADDVWEVEFSPNDFSICDESFQIKITEPVIVQAPSTWQNVATLPVIGGSPSNFATRTATQFTTTAIMGQVYVAAKLPVSIQSGATPNPITAAISFTGALSGTYVNMFFGSGNSIVSIASQKFLAGINPTDPGVFTFPALSGDADFLYIYIDFTGDTASFVGSITVNPLYQIYIGDPVLKSDCLSVRTTQDCTELIGYTNSSDFDGIDYSDLSPGRTFYLRVPAMFFEEKNPQEQEDLELSNGVVVTLRNSIQQKRKFETDFMPNYMHLKLQKVLMHETIIIDGTQWKKRDSYDDNPIRKYNLKKASVLLTKYNSVEKNTI